MSSMTISAEAAAPEIVEPGDEPKIPTPLSVIGWLSMAAALLSLLIAAALSLIVCLAG
jgi:hypothetical protein